ncbi:NB-ARC domain-containing protein [Corchorus olitorius]|uniref:NB-ARC domain-containing protein n=1 Tax=Corchorus olitorius TaxID=93759 RepID=A0A1R3I1P0_9ROSI|nr:NB-ARC domain-containing protein [Corchorus olitorius]
MAESIVSIVGKRSLDLLAHEADLLHGVEEEVGRLVTELERMTSALKDADRRQEQHELSRTVVKQIRELAYEAEDVIDTYILNVSHRNRLTRFMTMPLHLHTVGKKVRAIKTKLDDISRSLPTYKEISGEGESSISNSRPRLFRRTYSHAKEEFVLSLEVITREVLALLMKGEDSLRVVSIVGMGGIDDESWELFSKKAFPGDGIDSSQSQFENLGKEMVKKCGGLPLAIIVLGGLLATKRSLAQWEMVQRKFNADLNKYGAVNGILVLSYHDLPLHLKSCFLYFGHYPEDWEISKKELLRLWIAEGFISPPPESGGLLMEDEAEQCLEELINRCLVQVGKKDHTGRGVKTCRMHDLLRDMCVEKAQEQNFLGIVQPPSNVNNGPGFRVNLAELKERRIAIQPSKRDVYLKENITKLTLKQSMMWVDPMAELEKLQHLRTLRFWNNSYCGTKLICSANGFPQLDYLELESLPNLKEWQIEEGAMPRLRSLKLESCWRLKMVPEGLKYITTLQEMTLRHITRSFAERIQVIDGREGENFFKVRHIPSIQIKIMGT